MGRKDIVYDYIKERILDNHYKPGDPLREIELSETLGTSRTPVREALRALEAEGLVDNYAGRGMIVTNVSAEDVKEISQLRELLEVWCLEQSFEWITSKELNTVKKAFEKANHNGKWESMHEADRMLHQIFIQKSGNRRVLQFMNLLNTQIERIRRVSAQYQGRNETSYQEHMAIIEAIEEHDLERSKELLSNHLRSVGKSAIAMARTVQTTGLML